MAKPTDPNDAMERAQPSPWHILLGLLAFAVIWSLLANIFGSGPQELSYTTFKEQVRQGRVVEVTIEGDEIRGHFSPEPKGGTAAEAEGRPQGADAEGPPIQAQRPRGEPFVTTKPRVDDPTLLELLEEHGVTVHAESPEPTWWQQAIGTLLPWLFILGLFLYLTYRMQQRLTGGGDGGPGGIFGFAKSKAKRFREEVTRTTLDDVAGLANAKRDLKEIIDNLAHPERYQALGAKIPKGVLLVGPPGTGKTLIARAVAGEAGVPFYSISGSEFVEMFVGVGAARVRDMFDSAKKEAPCVIFIDEIDAVGRSRGAGLGGGHDEREQTLNQILSEMDGFTPNQNVVVLAATNRPDVLDQALLRPGRFDRKVFIEMPDREARKAILEVHTREVPLGQDVDLERVAARTVGFSGADLANLVNEAALLAGRRRKERVDMALFDLARDKLVLGAERERGIGEEERRLVAYHESGHALMAWLLPEADPLDKVTIIPRGRALGATEQLPEEERMNLKRAYLLDRIGVMLGGRVAERVVFDELSSGAESDLEQATRLARRMVCRWGMSEALGPVAFKRGDEHIFLGRELTQQQDFSDATAKLIDDEVKRLLEAAEGRDRELMEGHRDELDRLAEALLEEETIGRERIEALFQEASQATERTGTSG
jgi:cell division protease FtsH